jgi:hypothetical protein
MDLEQHVESVEEALAATSAAGTDEAQRLAAVLASALRPAVRLALLDAVAELASEATLALGDRVVEVRLDDGSEVRVSVSDVEPPDGPELTPHLEAAEGTGASRVTLRLPGDLKAQAESAAAARGVSLNTWLVRAVGEAVRREPSPSELGSHRIRGWVQP